MTIDLCTYNVGNAAHDRVATDLRRLMARFPVVGLQEVADRKAEMNATGAQVVTEAGQDKGHVAVLVGAKVPIEAFGYVPCTKRKRVGAWGAGPSVIAAKWIVWARVTIDGASVTVGSTHMVPSVQRPAHSPAAVRARAKRRALYHRHIAAVAAWSKTVTGPLVIVADWNATSDFDALQPLRDAGLTCSSAPSHGNRDIDQMWSRNLEPVSTEALPGFSSDHKPVTTTYEHKGEPVPTPNHAPPATDRVTFRTKLMDNQTMYGLMSAEAILGYELTVTQGCYSTAVGASAGTHAGGGVVDLAPFDQARKVRVLRDLGWFAWHRPELWRNGVRIWPEHIHAGMIGHPTLSPAAADQVAKYRRGEDGLADPPTADPNPYRPNPEVVYDYHKGYRDSLIRDRNDTLRSRIKTLRDRISANRNRITYK